MIYFHIGYRVMILLMTSWRRIGLGLGLAPKPSSRRNTIYTRYWEYFYCHILHTHAEIAFSQCVVPVHLVLSLLHNRMECSSNLVFYFIIKFLVENTFFILLFLYLSPCGSSVCWWRWNPSIREIRYRLQSGAAEGNPFHLRKGREGSSVLQQSCSCIYLLPTSRCKVAGLRRVRDGGSLPKGWSRVGKATRVGQWWDFPSHHRTQGILSKDRTNYCHKSRYIPTSIHFQAQQHLRWLGSIASQRNYRCHT